MPRTAAIFCGKTRSIMGSLVGRNQTTFRMYGLDIIAVPCNNGGMKEDTMYNETKYKARDKKLAKRKNGMRMDKAMLRQQNELAFRARQAVKVAQ
jgi:hypothetical protein